MLKEVFERLKKEITEAYLGSTIKNAVDPEAPIEVDPKAPAASMDEAAPAVEEKDVPRASVDKAPAALEAEATPSVEERESVAPEVAAPGEDATVDAAASPVVKVKDAPVPVAEEAEGTPAPVVGEKVAEEVVAPVSEPVSEFFPAVADAEVGSRGAEVKTTTNEEAPGVEDAASLADVPDHVEEDAAPASSLGSDAPVTDQQSLPVESSTLDVADPVEDVPAITEVTPPAVGSVDAPSRVALAEAPKGDEEHIESAEVEHPEAPVVDEEKRKVSDDNSWRSFTKEIQTEAVTASEAAPTA